MTTGKSHQNALHELFAKEFSPAYLGTVFILLWNQCVLYAQRVQVDGGITTIEINFARCLCIALLALWALRPAFRKFPRALEVASIALMTTGSALFLAQSALDVDLQFIAAVICGFGLTWGGGMWIEFYKRLDAPRALAYATVSLLVSAIVGIAICFAPVQTAFYLGILLPIVSYICYLQAQRSLSESGRPEPVRDEAYTAEPRSTIWRIAGGIALFSFVLGISRGFPDGSSVTLPPAFQVLQYAFLIMGLGITLTGVFNGKRRPSIVPAWLSLLLLLAVGVLSMASMSDAGMLFGATLLSTVNLAQVALLWVLAYDVSRHVPEPACVVVGFFWLLHLLFREAGRLLILEAGPQIASAQTLLVGLLLLLIVASMGLLLTDKIPRTRAFFSGFEDELNAVWANPSMEKEDVGTNRAPFETLSSHDETVLENASTEEPSTAAPEQPAHVWDDARYGLTEREKEVAALLAQGRTAKVVAEDLYLSAETVRGYTKSIYAKLGIHSKQELIDLARN